MTPERWKRIEVLYHSALAREGGGRASYLEEACAGDDELRREVDSLLSNAGQSEDFLESQALEAAARHYVSAVLPDLSGKRLGRYEVMARLGGGGMGEVYRARDTRLKREVALKVLRPESVADPDRRRRFEQEARAASALDHPNIVIVHDIDQAEGVDFIAMEYVHGKTLAERIPRKGLPVAEVLKYAIQMADALAAAHEAGIVHRDLKPANIMVSDSGRVKVLDFGLAKLTVRAAGEQAASTQTARFETESGTILGTVTYMSPEQAEGKNADARSDIFSFGAVLYEMLTGHRAFERDSTASTLAAILKEEPKPLREIIRNMPPDLDKILTRCLRKEPDRRFQHMDDLKVALEDLKQEFESGAPAASATPTRKHRPIFVWAGIILAVAAFAIAAWLASRRQTLPQLVAVPLTTDPGFEVNPTFSPDGAQVAYCWDGPKQDNVDIYVKLIGSESVLRLTNDPAPDINPAWSPDRRWIAFERYFPSAKRGVFLVSAIGGSERKVGEKSGCSRGLSWHPDGKWLAISDAGSAGGPCSLFALSVDTGEKRRLTSPPPNEWDTDPAFSFDGRRLAFGRSLSLDEWVELFVLTLRDDLTPQGEPRRLTFKNQVSRYPAWTSDGRDIVFSSFRAGGGPELWRMPASGSRLPGRLMFAGGQGLQPAISHRGNLLAYARLLVDENIWRIELAGPNRKAARLVNLLSSTVPDASPQYSPDGKNIVFTSARSGSLEVWVCAADGANPRKLTSMGARMTGAPRWSPDGKQIVFDSTASGNSGVSDVYVIDASGGRPRRLTEGKFQEGVASWSRDGRHIYFVSDRTGRPEVWKMPARGGEAVQVTRNGGYVAFESSDGRSLYFSKSVEQSSLWRVPVGGGAEHRILESVLGLGFVVMDKGIYFEQPELDGGASIRFLDFSTGRTNKIYTIEHPSYTGCSVSPDERYILCAQFDQRSSDLMLVENFR